VRTISYPHFGSAALKRFNDINARVRECDRGHGQKLAGEERAGIESTKKRASNCD
jgi:hypothetical protein